MSACSICDGSTLVVVSCRAPIVFSSQLTLEGNHNPIDAFTVCFRLTRSLSYFTLYLLHEDASEMRRLVLDSLHDIFVA